MILRGATIAVTGATGFLGRYIVDALLARGARVVGGGLRALRARGARRGRAAARTGDAAAAVERVPDVEGALRAGGVAAREGVWARAHDRSPVHHLRRLRPELHAGLQARHGPAA